MVDVPFAVDSSFVMVEFLDTLVVVGNFVVDNFVVMGASVVVDASFVVEDGTEVVVGGDDVGSSTQICGNQN